MFVWLNYVLLNIPHVIKLITLIMVRNIILHVCNLGFESRQEHIGLRISNNKQLEGLISLNFSLMDVVKHI